MRILENFGELSEILNHRQLLIGVVTEKYSLQIVCNNTQMILLSGTVGM